MQSKFNIDVPILISNVSNHEILKPTLLNILDNAPSVSSNKKNDKITKTDYFIDSSQYRHYVDVLVPNIIDQMYYLYENMIKLEWRGLDSFATFWFQQYYINDQHEWHNHPGSNYNAIYYVELPDDGPRTELKSPISDIVITPEVNEGQILIFPSFFLHRSPKNKSKERKTIIAFNLV